MKKFKNKCYVLLGMFAIFNGAIAQESKIAEAKIISVSNPLQSHGIQVGDVLSRRVVLEVKAPYQLSQQTLPMKGARTNDVELSQISITQSASREGIQYNIDLRYQVFSAVFVPSVLQLPAEKFALTGGPQALSVSLPAWKFWFSPLAPTAMS
jgi:mxaA protein